MRNALMISLMTVILALSGSFAAAAQKTVPKQTETKASVSGSWTLTVKRPNSTATAQAELKLLQDGESVSGDYTGFTGESKVNGTFKDKTLQVFVPIKAEGKETILSYLGKLQKNGTLKGTYSIEQVSGTWSAVRKKAD